MSVGDSLRYQFRKLDFENAHVLLGMTHGMAHGERDVQLNKTWLAYANSISKVLKVFWSVTIQRNCQQIMNFGEGSVFGLVVSCVAKSQSTTLFC
jgi:hypothetical protein